MKHIVHRIHNDTKQGLLDLLEHIPKYNSVKKDILLAKDHLINPFILGGHDYRDPRTPGVTHAVNETIGKPDLTFIDHSWIKIIKE